MIDGSKPHPSYRSSKHPRLYSIPAHWTEKRAKYVFREVDCRSTTGGEELLSVSHLSGVRRRKDINASMLLAESNVGHKVCAPGDLVINTMWAWMGALAVSPYRGLVSPAYGVYRPIPDADVSPYYLHHLLRTPQYVADYVARSTGLHSSRLRLYPDIFLRTPIVIPPPHEQVAIVRYLNHATHEIDRTIREKKALTSLLVEQKQAVIHRSVTGIDSTVTLKPSGIPWLGDIPMHWQALALKRWVATRITDGPHETPALLESGIPFMSAESMVSGKLDFSRCRGFISRELHESFCRKCRPQRDDIFMCKSGATTGKVAIVETDDCFSVWSPLALIRVDKARILPRLLFLILQSGYIQRQVRELSSYGTQPNLAMGAMAQIMIALPPITEQPELLRRVESSVLPINAFIAGIEREITMIQEYRTRLVADIVTGKLDVRAAAVSLPADADEPLPVASDTDVDDHDTDEGVDA